MCFVVSNFSCGSQVAPIVTLDDIDPHLVRKVIESLIKEIKVLN